MRIAHRPNIHPVVLLAMALGLGDRVVSRRLLFAGVVASELPDLDVVGLHVGVPYAAEFSHSILFAFLVATAATCLFRFTSATPYSFPPP